MNAHLVDNGLRIHTPPRNHAFLSQSTGHDYSARVPDRAAHADRYGTTHNPICHVDDGLPTSVLARGDNVDGELIRGRMQRLKIPHASADAVLQQLGDSGAANYIVHGPANAGKSTVLENYRKSASARGEIVLSTSLMGFHDEVPTDWHGIMEASGILEFPEPKNFWDKIAASWKRKSHAAAVEKLRGERKLVGYLQQAAELARAHGKSFTVLADEANRAMDNGRSSGVVRSIGDIDGIKKVFVFGYVSASEKEQLTKLQGILSAAQNLELKAVAPEDVKVWVRAILADSGLTLSDSALDQLIADYQGRMRELIALLTRMSRLDRAQLFSTSREIDQVLNVQQAQEKLRQLGDCKNGNLFVVLSPTIRFEQFYAKACAEAGVPRVSERDVVVPIAFSLSHLIAQGNIDNYKAVLDWALSQVEKTGILDPAQIAKSKSGIFNEIARSRDLISAIQIFAHFFSTFAEHFRRITGRNLQWVMMIDDLQDQFLTAPAKNLVEAIVDHHNNSQLVVVRRKQIRTAGLEEDPTVGGMDAYLRAHLDMNHVLDSRNLPADYFGD